MSWIEDVNYELDKIDSSDKSLRKFGITVGLVLLLVSYWLYFQSFQLIFVAILVVISSFLILLGLLKPRILQKTYKYWMGLAFVLGWFVSRFLLTLLFIFVLTPIALVAKLFGKDFLNLSSKKKKIPIGLKRA